MATSAATLVRGRYVLTSAAAGAVEDGAVRIVDGRIDAVGPYDRLSADHPDDAVTGGEHDVITPGFVNTHGHFSEGLTAGVGEEHTLWEWVNAVVAPVAPHLDEETAYLGTLVAGIQMLRSGITLANDMFVCYPAEDAPPVTPGVVRALDELGLRGVVSFGAGDVRSGTSVGRLLEEHAALEAAAKAGRLSRFRVGVVSVGAQSPDLFARSIGLAADADHGVHIHLQEAREEVTVIRVEHGVTPIGLCTREGLFDVPTIAAHCVWADAADRELLAAHGVGVAHNPVANMILASGVCPVPELLRLGVAVGLGVDGAGSNDRQDFLEVMKTAVLLQRVHHLQATALSARDALHMATIGGARALGLEDELGSIEEGKAADLVVFDGTSPALANLSDPYQAIVYCAGPREVKDVWVAGERSVVDGDVTRVDPAEVTARARPRVDELARLGFGRRPGPDGAR
jgi:5-methylthioadenosine/S-adenosylhomocysteine deaminase